MAEASATAEGDLGRTPLAHLLVYALDRRLTGALFLTQADGVEHVVRLARGAPVKARPGDRYALLGQMLVEAGAIDEATLNAALETKGLLGDMLLLAGRIERDVLEKIAEEQFVRRMVRLFELPPDTKYRYFDGHDELRDYGGDPANVDPIALIWSGLRANAERSALMDATLALLGEKAMRLHPAATVSRFGFTGPEADLHEFLALEPVTLDELVGLELAPLDLTRRFAYALLITRQLEMGAGTTPLGAVDSGRSAATAPAAPQAALARMALRSTVHRVGAAAPDLPGDGERGPGPSAAVTRAAARRAREQAAKAEAAPATEAPPTERSSTLPAAPPSTTPAPPTAPSVPETKADAAPAPDSGVVLSPAAIAAIEASPASTTLRSEPEPPAKEPEPPDPFAGKTAVELLTLARERLAERDAKAAVAACEAARKHAPEDCDVIALGAWARFQAGSADVKALTIELDELLAAQQKHVPARYYRAMLRKRLSDQAGCVRDLRQVLELDPGHADATRELAALDTKQGGDEPKSFMNRLFKR
jgi:hypothetical protein